MAPSILLSRAEISAIAALFVGCALGDAGSRPGGT